VVGSAWMTSFFLAQLLNTETWFGNQGPTSWNPSARCSHLPLPKERVMVKAENNLLHGPRPTMGLGRESVTHLLPSLGTEYKVLLNKNHATCGKERFIGNQTTGLSLSGSEWSSLAEMSSGLYRRSQAMGEGERVWCLINCAYQMEQVNMPG
jgi:hypothetical protein